MRWNAYFSLANTYDTNDDMNKEIYGFKSKHHLSITKQLETFEKESSINSSSNVLLFADKTNNIY